MKIVIAIMTMKIVLVTEKLARVTIRIMMNNEELKYLIRKKFNAISDPYSSFTYENASSFILLIIPPFSLPFKTST